jgi:hypothetical protein
LRSALGRELLVYDAHLFLKHLPSKTIKWNIIQYRYLASIALQRQRCNCQVSNFEKVRKAADYNARNQ